VPRTLWNWRWLPPETTPDAAVLIAARGVRAFGDGFVSVLLPVYLLSLGLDGFQIGGVATATLVGTAGVIFFWTGVCSSFSYLVAVRMAERIGLVNTMVFTHLPSNVLRLLVPFMPDLPLAILLLLARSALSQMDVPTRNSHVMAVVPQAERPAAASVTSVPRSLASAASPLLSGYLLGLSTFGWPLVIGGVLKGIYDLLLLAMFARVKPPEEVP